LSDIPARNEKIIIASVANGTIGSNTVDIPLSDIHPHNIEMFLRVNKIFGMNANGIDYITHNLSIPHYYHGKILEINARPSINSHYKTNPGSIDKLVKLIRF